MKKHVIVIASYSFKGGTMYVKKYALQSNHTSTHHIIYPYQVLLSNLFKGYESCKEHMVLPLKCCSNSKQETAIILRVSNYLHLIYNPSKY